ncbi:MAG: A/G-specific adenine glycosylase [Chloroflexi bacterium]|nr:A/G-specific adenine glycosylase [Chloroflexota bacterium]
MRRGSYRDLRRLSRTAGHLRGGEGWPAPGDRHRFPLGCGFGRPAAHRRPGRTARGRAVGRAQLRGAALPLRDSPGRAAQRCGARALPGRGVGDVPHRAPHPRLPERPAAGAERPLVRVSQEFLPDLLLAWYARQGRDLPWRHTRDPYAILVAEVMLQQTQVERVVPRYREFLACFPSLEALAAASRAEVIRAWAPLGYNLRAVRLHALAQQAVQEFGGHLPADPQALRRLKGLGPYTAAAVACFAFDLPVPVVDTNVRRVLARALLGEVDARHLPPRQVAALAAQALPAGRAYDWNQALMDLGATVCTALQPACARCPLERLCLARPQMERWQAARSMRERPADYRVNSPFQGSSRYYRGRIVDALRAVAEGASLDLLALGRAIKPDFEAAELPWLLDLVQRLERDGLVRVLADRVMLA